MIYRDTEDIYIEMPVTAASILVRSIIQAVVSMKLDNNSDDISVQSAEFSLLQFANMINNANEFKTEEQRIEMYKLFSKYYGEKDSTEPMCPPDSMFDEIPITFEEEHDSDDDIHAVFGKRI